MQTQRQSSNFKNITAQLHWVHWCVIIASAILTLVAWLTSKKAVEEKAAILFDREATQIIELITERMRQYEDALWAGVSMIQSHSGEIDHRQWAVFSDYLEIEEKYPGINGIGVIYYVPPVNLDAFLQSERLTRPDFRIHPQHNKDEYWPITYIEPVATNMQAVGLDMAHELNRYTAATKARDTGTAQITGPITLVQDAAKTPGFLFYVPFYRSNDITSIEKKQEHFIGLVYAPFIMSKLMEGTLRKEQRNIGIQIKDAEELLYDEHFTDIDDYDPEPLFTRHVSLDFYGRSWEIDLRSTLDFRAAVNNKQPTVILISGLIIECLLIGLFVSLAKSNKSIATKLNASEYTRQLYLESSGDGYWDWHIQDDYEYMSPRFWAMFGYAPEEKPHKPSAWQDIIFEEDLAIALDNFNKHVATKGEYPYEQEVRYRHKNGSVVTVLCRGHVVEWDDQQQAVRMIGTHTDITELKQQTQALDKALEFQKLLTNVNTDLIFVKDEQFRIVEANPAFLNFYPADKRAKVIGTTTLEQYDEQSAEEFLVEDKKAFAEGISEVVETATFPDGIQRTLFTKKLRFEDNNNETFILGIARDITELKETEKALIKANEELEEFAYRTSHDLRSPLISSNKLLSIVMSTLAKGDTEKSIEYIRLVQDSLGKLETLVSDILTMTKLNHSDVPLVPVDIPTLIKETLQKLSHMDGYERIEFITDNKYHQHIHVQQDHIIRVIENMLSNAVKYQNPEQAAPFVRISIERLTNKLQLTITDNGLGIPEKSQDKLFMMFKRFHPNTSFGSGLGLYMVAKSVAKMGGTIEYQNTGDGSIFLINLPIND